MTSWTADDLTSMARHDELGIASKRPDGSLRPFVTIWFVSLGDDVYVRSAHGYDNPWFQRASRPATAGSNWPASTATRRSRCPIQRLLGTWTPRTTRSTTVTGGASSARWFRPKPLALRFASCPAKAPNEHPCARGEIYDGRRRRTHRLRVALRPTVERVVGLDQHPACLTRRQQGREWPRGRHR